MKVCMVCGAKFADSVRVCPADGARLLTTAQEHEVGAILEDKYELVQLIGKGSLGKVFKAKLPDGKFVAMKILHVELSGVPEALIRFRREGQLLSIIEHPNIISLHEFGELKTKELFFTTEYLSGKTLGQLLAEKKQLTITEAMPIFRQVCAGLAEAHSYGFIHRDMKPSNIMIQDDSNVKLLDFSLAKLPPLAVGPARATTDGMVRGTPAYMSPEQCESMEVDARSDIYSLATIVFETFTGQRPFPGKHPLLVMQQQLREPPPRMVAVRPDLAFASQLEELIQISLSKKPEARPANLQEFLRLLEEAAAAQALTAV